MGFLQSLGIYSNPTVILHVVELTVASQINYLWGLGNIKVL